MREQEGNDEKYVASDDRYDLARAIACAGFDEKYDGIVNFESKLDKE